jgi:hypothetical protein
VLAQKNRPAGAPAFLVVSCQFRKRRRFVDARLRAATLPLLGCSPRLARGLLCRTLGGFLGGLPFGWHLNRLLIADARVFVAMFLPPGASAESRKSVFDFALRPSVTLGCLRAIERCAMNLRALEQVLCKRVKMSLPRASAKSDTGQRRAVLR